MISQEGVMKQQAQETVVVESTSRTNNAVSNKAAEERGATQKKVPQWAVTHKARLPHKVGLPLGSGGGGDDGN